MGLESATYINDLVNSNPTGLDEVNKGDDHLRLIKSVLQNSFTDIGNAVITNDTELNLLSGLTAEASELNILDGGIISVTELNYSSGLTGNIQDQIDNIDTQLAQLFPIGHILHSSNSANPGTYGYPGTWARIARGRVLIGEGTGSGLTTRVAGTTLGQEDAIVPSHSHNINQTPHGHRIRGLGSDDDGGPRVPGSNNTGASNAAIEGANANITINSTGEGVSDKNMQPSLVVYIWERTA